MKKHRGPASTVPKAYMDRRLPGVPDRFTVGEHHLVRFKMREDVHSHRTYELQSDNAAVLNGKGCTKGLFDTELRLKFRRSAKAKLVVRVVHKYSLWPSKYVFTLKAGETEETEETEDD